MMLVGDSGKVYEYGRKDVRTGIVSRIDKNSHIVLIDFDEEDLDSIKRQIHILRKKVQLPTAYIFSTSQGRYSVMIFRRVSWRTYRKILFNVNCCVNFRYYTITNRVATLRIDPKPDKDSALTLVCADDPNHFRNKSFENQMIKESVFLMIRNCGGRI